MDKIKHYKIVNLLGSGGMGEVYKAVDPLLEREVAIKVMHPHLCDDDKVNKRFVQEAQAAAGLTHPNIVSIYEIGKANGGWYIVMEYIKGVPLTTYLSKKTSLEPNVALNFIAQVLGALSFAHAKGILHRDIKPDNIMITNNEVAKILDFGIAKILTKKGLTVAGDILGTVEYMAPEQMLGETIDRRSDIYSVGILAYQILTKRLPFDDDSPVGILYKKLNEDPIPPSYYNHRVGHDLDQVVLRAIIKDKSDRWGSASAFADSIQSILKETSNTDKPRNNHTSKLSEFYINVGSKRPSLEINKFHSTFVGREKELQRLMCHIDNINKGQGQTIILKGEAGVGKSTLVNKLTTSLDPQKTWFLSGACLYQQGLNAYLPFMDAIRGFFSRARTCVHPKKQSEIRKLIKEKVPLLEELTEVATTDSGAKIVTTALQEGSDSEKLFEAWCQLINLLNTMHPIVLIIDDLHLADEASLRLFHYIAHHISDKRLLLLGITRADRYDLQKDGKPTVVSDILSRISRERNCEQITLYRLVRETCDSLVDQSLSPALFTDDFYEHIYKETKGNPLFVLETLKLLIDNGIIYEKDGIWKNSQERIDITIPKKVEDVFIQKLGALSSEERDLLQIAAVIGYKFGASRLSRISCLPKIDILKMLQRVEAELQIINGTEVGYHFEHPMIRDILYNEITYALRQEYHSMIAADLEKVYKGDYGDKVGVMAEHLLNSGQQEKAAPLLYQAAQHSFGLGLYRESSKYIKDYIDIFERTDSIIHLDLYFKLGKCYEQTGRWDESREAYKLLLGLGKKKKELMAQVEALESLGRVHIKLGDHDAAFKAYNRCIEFAKKHKIANVLGKVYNNLGVLHFKKGNLEIAERYLTKSINEKKKDSIAYGKAFTLMNLGIIANMQANYDIALKRYAEALNIYNTEKDKQNQVRVQVNIGMTYLDRGEYSKALRVFNKGLRLLVKIEDQELRGLIHLNMAKAYTLTENYSKAEKLTKKALKIFKLMGDTRNVAEAYHIFGLMHGMRGNLSEAELFLKESINLNEKVDHFEGIAETCQSYAEIYEKANRITNAREFYQKAITTYKKLNLNGKIIKLQAKLAKLLVGSDTEKGKLNVIHDQIEMSKKIKSGFTTAH